MATYSDRCSVHDCERHHFGHLTENGKRLDVLGGAHPYLWIGDHKGMLATFDGREALAELAAALNRALAPRPARKRKGAKARG
jgi:hypothetical protein